jgi:hypothetical protein
MLYFQKSAFKPLFYDGRRVAAGKHDRKTFQFGMIRLDLWQKQPGTA